jgi:hypothetical protein
MVQAVDAARAEERAMRQVGGGGSQPYVAMVLRRTPPARHRLSETLTGVTTSPGDVWWELVDPAAPPDDPPAGAALTRSVDHEETHVVVLRRSDDREEDAAGDLLALLIAALRGTTARELSMEPDAQTPAAALLEAGFVADDEATAPGLHVLVL